MSKKPTSIRASDLTVRQLAELISATGMSQTELISTAIDRMHREEIDMNNLRPFTNTAEEYGEDVPANIDDYRELNPDGDFEQRDDEIIERLPSGEVVTVARKTR